MISRASISLIYLDTNIWNRLFERNINPQELIHGLAQKSVNLVLSGQAIYELSKTFFSSHPGSSVRAQGLFRFLKQFVDSGVPCAHDNMEQLFGEIDALRTGGSSVVAFYGVDHYRKLKEEVDKLASGVLDERAKQFVEGRKQFSSSTRSSQKRHLAGELDVKDRLKAIPRNELEAWLQSEMLSDSGTAILTGHLLRMYDDIPPRSAIRCAHDLLHLPPPRMAKGVVRADLYSNWRCANRGSNPKDLVDDMYHVLNSTYCDVYATAEPGQMEYVSLLLTGGTQTAIYNDQTPIDKWLLSLV